MDNHAPPMASCDPPPEPSYRRPQGHITEIARLNAKICRLRDDHHWTALQTANELGLDTEYVEKVLHYKDLDDDRNTQSQE